MWDAETGGALLVIDVGSEVTGIGGLCGTRRRARRGSLVVADKTQTQCDIDPVAGGEALLVIDVGSRVLALAVFTDPATGALRLACGGRGVTRINPGGEA